ncbi:MAG: hypothetical protein WCI72_01980 [archaeon]
MGILTARWRDKFYENKEGEIPEGVYLELNSSKGGKDLRRALLNVDTGDLFLTNEHYAIGSFRTVGNVGYSPRQMLVGTEFAFI